MPLIFALLAAKFVGDQFNIGVFDAVIRVRKAPLLDWDPEPEIVRSACVTGIRARTLARVCVKV